MTCQNSSHLQATPKILFRSNRHLIYDKALLYYKYYFGVLLKLSTCCELNLTSFLPWVTFWILLNEKNFDTILHYSLLLLFTPLSKNTDQTLCLLILLGLLFFNKTFFFLHHYIVARYKKVCFYEVLCVYKNLWRMECLLLKLSEK